MYLVSGDKQASLWSCCDLVTARANERKEHAISITFGPFRSRIYTHTYSRMSF